MHYRKLVCPWWLAYFEKSLISNELKGRMEMEDRKEEIELVGTKRGKLIIFGHGKWLDKKIEKPGDNIKYRVKIMKTL